MGKDLEYEQNVYTLKTKCISRICSKATTNYCQGDEVYILRNMRHDFLQIIKKISQKVGIRFHSFTSFNLYIYQSNSAMDKHVQQQKVRRHITFTLYIHRIKSSEQSRDQSSFHSPYFQVLVQINFFFVLGLSRVLLTKEMTAEYCLNCKI